MIKLIDRNHALNLSPALSYTVTSTQQALLDEVSQEMDDSELSEFKEDLDDVGSHPEYKCLGELRLSLIDPLPEELPKAIKILFEFLNISEVAFLPEFKRPWLSQENNYAPVLKACRYIKTVVNDNAYNAGILSPISEIEELLLSVFWIMRCNAATPYIYFSGVGLDVTFSICKHGVLHAAFFDEPGKQLLISGLKGAGLMQVEECIDILDDYAISGRQIIV